MTLGLTSSFLAILAAAMLGPPVYTLAPIEAHVFDKETGEPIAGALVIAHWVLDGPNGDRVATLRLDEAITDEKGRFYFSGIGPVARPMKGVLDTQDPELIIFKPGYAASRLRNGAGSAPNERLWASGRKSDWDKARIPLALRPVDEKEYARELRAAFRGLARLFIENECHWKLIPRALPILDEENRRERAAGVQLLAVPSLDQLNQMKCS